MGAEEEKGTVDGPNWTLKQPRLMGAPSPSTAAGDTVEHAPRATI